MNNPNAMIGAALTRERLASGKSLSGLAAEAGIAKSTLSQLEAGLRERYHEQGEEERRGRTAAARLRMRAIRHLVEAMGARAASAAFDGGEA